MRRLLSTSALLGLFAPALVLVPAVSPATAVRPHPVAPSVRSLDVPQPAAGLRTGATRFDTVGASWDTGATGTVEVRTHSRRGWSSWSVLDAGDSGPDAGSREDHGRARTVSEPLWAGPSDAAQLRAVGGAVRGLRLTLVDAGTSSADADPAGGATGAGVASAQEAQPAVYSRAQWGADESLRTYNSGCGTPEYGSTVKVGFVHHTDTPNGYASADVPSILRGIYAYHVKSNGWCDIGYNFLVDRFGRVWEGRYGGIARPVIGAHTGGFNTDSFGTSMIGTYTSVTPSSATQAALARLFAWKLGLHHADPLGHATLVSAGGPNTVYPAGQSVSFNVVAGHRDVGDTSCPGNAGYAILPALRNAVRADMGAALLYPASSARSRPWAGSPVTVTARVPKAQTWRLDVQRSSDRSVVRTITGSASSSLTATFDLKDRTGAWLPPGGYTLALTSAAGSDPAVPWSTPFDITTTSSSPPAAGTPPPVPASFVPVTPVRVLDTRSGLGSDMGAGAVPAQGRVEAGVLGHGQVPSSGVAGVVVNLTGIAHAGSTYLSAYPAENPWPGTSSVNLAAGQVHAALVTLGVGSSGRVSVYNGASTADAVLDVVGYFPLSGGSSYTAVTPSRLVDTRVTRTPFSNGQVRSIAVAGRAGVPSGATGVVLNATVTGAASSGLLSVFPSGSSRPPTSTLNFAQGEVTSNRVFSGLSGGALSVYAQATRVDVVLDVVGYFSASATGSRFTPVTPARVLDTRSANGVPRSAPVADGSTTVVKLAGRGGVPTSATAVLVTLTVTDTAHDGYVTGWSGVGARPLVSDVNTRSHRTVANLAVLALDPGTGSASLYNAGGSADLVGDVLGYLAPPAPAG